MNLTTAIDRYVDRRHSEGASYINGESVLRALCREVGDVPLQQLTSLEITKCLYNSRCSPRTCRGKHSMVRRFLAYWSVRGEVPDLALPIPPRANAAFLPYVYSYDQIRAMMAAVEKPQRGSPIVSARTMKMLLLTLYATGGGLQEVLQLRWCEVDLQRSELMLNGTQRICRRRIPICRDLAKSFQKHSDESRVALSADSRLFTSLSGKPLTRNYVTERFLRLLQVASVTRNDGVERSPRIQDFRATFAVHRIQAWLKEGADLDRRLPSLSAYMGYASLCAANKYLRLAPDHLRADILKLSNV